MRAVYIIVEGQTEEEFIYTSLLPYLNGFGIYDVRPILIQTSPGHKGGDLNFNRYKQNATRLLRQEQDILVTSLIDFFRLHRDFPQYDKSKKIANKQQRVKFLENAISERINDKRFIPYIQLHEFEGLLFSDARGFDYIPNIPIKNKKELMRTIREYPNPELLNDGAKTAPSKRLERLIPAYQKTLHGPIIAEEISIPIILSKCPRFRLWTEAIIEKMN